MRKRKFLKSDIDTKRAFTIIEIRKQILADIAKKYDNIDRDVYTAEERKIIGNELKSHAEMVRDKDFLMEVVYSLKKISRKEKQRPAPLVEMVRESVIDMLRRKWNGTRAEYYDSDELPIVQKELEEIETLIIEKDRVRPTFHGIAHEKKGKNAHVNKFFNLDLEPNVK